MEKDLTVGSPFRTIFFFALPVMGGNLFQLLYTLADTIIVGRTLGPDALSAVGATGTVVTLVLLFVQGVTGGFGICLGQRYGAGDTEGLQRNLGASWILSGIVLVAITAVSCGCIHQILTALKTPDRIYQAAYEYLFVILLGTGATVFYNMISNVLRALGDSRTPFFLLVFSALLNIVLDVVFIVPLQMGVGGAAWATVLSQFVSALLCTIIGLVRFPILRPVALWKEWTKSAKSLLAIGFPMGFQMAVMCIGQLAMQVAVNKLGPEAIAGFTAAIKVDQLSIQVNTAFATAVSSYVAQNYGADRFSRIRQGVTACLIQLEIANVLMGVFLLLCRNAVVPIFIDQPTQEIIQYSNQYLITVVPFYLVLGALIIYRAAIQSVGNALIPFLACIIELVMRSVAALGLVRVIGYGGVCFATPLAWIGATSLLVPSYFVVLKKIEQHQFGTKQAKA